MQSHLHTEAAEDVESSNLNFNTPVKMVSLQQKPFKICKEKLTTPRARSAAFVDEVKALKYRKPGKIASDNSTLRASPLSAGNCQKPWPSRKGAEAEELVKYMSRVPGYLQCVEREENVQEKALNFGVINWRRLQSWKGINMMDKKEVVSLSINQEEPFLCSARRSSISPTEDQRTRVVEDNSRCFHGLSSLKTSQLSSIKPHQECRSSMQGGVGSLVEEEKIESCQKQSCTDNKCLSDERLERNYMEVGGAQGHLRDSFLRANTLSAIHDNKKAAEASVALLTTKGMTATKSEAKREEGNQINRSLKYFVRNITEKSSHKEVEGFTGRQKQHLPDLPSDCGLKWINASSSTRVGSLAHLTKEPGNSGCLNDRERSNTRGSRSPLRRILDPLLKIKYHNNSEISASARVPHLHDRCKNKRRIATGKIATSLNAMPGSSDDSICSSCSQLSSNPQNVLQDESSDLPLKQALLKLAWKNRQPLFMFSANDNSLLVATIRTSSSNRDNFCGIYTIYKAQESSKKKAGAWIGPSRNRKPNLLYDVVGSLHISCHKLCYHDSKNFTVIKKFVLVGGELSLSNGVNSAFSNELAAVIVKTPFEKFDLCNSECENLDSLQVEHYSEVSGMSNVIAILPSGIHGSSDTGKPTALIERWKSGGSCDCGGWDEGCRLTILSDRWHEINNAKKFGCIELFAEGDKSKHSFSILAFKEGLDTVDFRSSISTMQAFVISIATLDCRNSINTIKHPIQRKSLKEYLFDKYPRINLMRTDGGPTSYLPHHPPLSPVGRA
ncbi:hypothetical protein AXF42_Ash017490 [Apostasia shenzhenica]|uniref:Uncharacterized protein n=1 Tax=Apostasia shenzhenica TaxID=1088818 RepID=A0A2H9ZZ68_9ASPA|nr:hypothetical protein AXF42_Ash017490 [Apostasia shenzhenica]